MEKVILKECPRHGVTEYVLRKDNVYRCKKCSSDAVQNARRRLKGKLVEYKGGKCEICGYNKCEGALEFHHLDSEEKEFQISTAKIKSFERLKQEADKCILVCANCHRELHYNMDKIARDEKEKIERERLNKYRETHKTKATVVGVIDKDEVIKMYETMTQKQIADHFHISVSSVKRILKS